MQNLKINISPTDRPQWHTPQAGTADRRHHPGPNRSSGARQRRHGRRNRRGHARRVLDMVHRRRRLPQRRPRVADVRRPRNHRRNPGRLTHYQLPRIP